MTDLSLLLGLVPAPKAISPQTEAQAAIPPWGSGKQRLLALLQGNPARSFTVAELSDLAVLGKSVTNKYLLQFEAHGYVTCLVKGRGGPHGQISRYQLGSSPAPASLRTSLEILTRDHLQLKKDFASLKQRAIDLVLSSEPDEHGRLSIQDIAKTLEDFL